MSTSLARLFYLLTLKIWCKEKRENIRSRLFLWVGIFITQCLGEQKAEVVPNSVKNLDFREMKSDFRMFQKRILIIKEEGVI